MAKGQMRSNKEKKKPKADHQATKLELFSNLGLEVPPTLLARASSTRSNKFGSPPRVFDKAS